MRTLPTAAFKLLLATHPQQHFDFFVIKIIPQHRIYQQIDGLPTIPPEVKHIAENNRM
jgi:hypothetical protein